MLASLGLQWHGGINLGDALSFLGEREIGLARLEQAKQAYQGVLEELDQSAYYRELTLKGLEHTMGLLAERQCSPTAADGTTSTAVAQFRFLGSLRAVTWTMFGPS